jgi:hypothetical protein
MWTTISLHVHAYRHNAPFLVSELFGPLGTAQYALVV